MVIFDQLGLRTGVWSITSFMLGRWLPLDGSIYLDSLAIHLGSCWPVLESFGFVKKIQNTKRKKGELRKKKFPIEY